MAPLRLLAALLAAQLQLNFGQKINEGNNLVAVASHKLAAIKQQYQKQNVTNSEDNVEVTADKDLEQGNLNTSAMYPGSGTSFKFVRNPAYDGTLPTVSLINSINKPDKVFGSIGRDTALFNLSSASPNNEQTYTAVGQATNQKTEDNLGFIAHQPPVFISFAPRCSGAVSSQSPYIFNASPTQLTLPNVVSTINPRSQPSPPLKQPPCQTLSTAQSHPSNVQNPTNMRLRFVPASNAVPLQNTGPEKSGVPTQSHVAIQKTKLMQSTIPVQNSVLMQNSVPMLNSVPMQSTVPIQSTMPIQSTIPMQSTVPLHSTMPIQRTISNVPIQNPIASMIQNPNLALLLAHALSENPVKQEYSTPSNSMSTIQDQKPTKQTAVKTLLPLILQLLAERNNNCCEYKNKKSHTYDRYKGYKKGNDKFGSDFGRYDLSHYQRGIQNKRLKKPFDDTLEEEDYSEEMSDYSGEEYDDED